MTKVQSTINLILKALAIGMAVPSIVLLMLDAVELDTVVMLLAIGLTALAVAALSENKTVEVNEE